MGILRSSYSKAIWLLAAGFFTIGSVSAATLQVICDNDFALFAGTSNGVSRLVYQNDFEWPTQIANAASLDVNLLPGETTFYLLGMGGGGDENIGGTLNGVDFTSINILQSSDISSYLPNYFDYEDGEVVYPRVADGAYSASLADVQAAFPHVSWNSPTVVYEGVGTYVTGSAFYIPTGTATLFRFSGDSVGITAAIPEPSTYALFGLGALALVVACRRKLAA